MKTSTPKKAPHVGRPTSESDGASSVRIMFRAAPPLVNAANACAKNEFLNGAGAVARKALILYLEKEGYYQRGKADQ